MYPSLDSHCLIIINLKIGLHQFSTLSRHFPMFISSCESQPLQLAVHYYLSYVRILNAIFPYDFFSSPQLFTIINPKSPRRLNTLRIHSFILCTIYCFIQIFSLVFVCQQSISSIIIISILQLVLGILLQHHASRSLLLFSVYVQKFSIRFSLEQQKTLNNTGLQYVLLNISSYIFRIKETFLSLKMLFQLKRVVFIIFI